MSTDPSNLVGTVLLPLRIAFLLQKKAFLSLSTPSASAVKLCIDREAEEVPKEKSKVGHDLSTG